MDVILELFPEKNPERGSRTVVQCNSVYFGDIAASALADFARNHAILILGVVLRVGIGQRVHIISRSKIIAPLQPGKHVSHIQSGILHGSHESPSIHAEQLSPVAELEEALLVAGEQKKCMIRASKEDSCFKALFSISGMYQQG